MVGSNRIIPGSKIVNPLGNADRSLEEEQELRRDILVKALGALRDDIKDQLIVTGSET